MPSDGELVGPQPDAHGVILRGEILHVAHALHALDGVHQVDVAVIAQEHRVVGAAGRIEADDHQDVRAGAVDHHAFALDRIGQLRIRLADAVLRVHLHDVHVRAHVEIGVQRELAVVGIVGLHVEQLVHAVDLGLDGRGDGFHDRFRRGAAIGRGDLNHRRADRRILGDGQPLEGDQADDHRQDGNDHRDDGAANEEVSHNDYSLPCLVSPCLAGWLQRAWRLRRRPRPSARRSSAAPARPRAPFAGPR